MAEALGATAAGVPAAIGGNVPPLPDPPAFDRYVLESPWLLAGGLAAVALVVLYAMRSQGKTRTGLVAAGVGLLLAGAIVAAGALIETPREIMTRQTRDLVRATATVDVPALEGLLAPDARLYWLERRSSVDRAQLLERVRSDLGRSYTVRDWAILKLDAALDGPAVGRTQAQVRVDPAEGGVHFSWWRIDWRREPDGSWRVIGIEPLFVQGLSR